MTTKTMKEKATELLQRCEVVTLALSLIHI